MEGISSLPDDAILYILQYLDSADRITFAFTCQRFRRLCMDAKLLRKVNLSRCFTGRQSVIKEFLRDKEMAKYIRELNLNNQDVINWQTDFNLKDFLITFSSHLEGLHVLNCGMTVKTLHHIVQRAHKLTSLSFSLMDLTSDDIEFLVQNMQSSDGICLENIKNLHLEILDSKQHLEILSYFVLFRCKYLHELEIIFWQLCDMHEAHQDKWNNVSFPQPSVHVADNLQHLHSLVVIKVDDYPDCCNQIHFMPMEPQVHDFICSVVRKKPHETKWKKFWISPPIDSNILCNMFHAVPVSQDRLHELHSVEALTVCALSKSSDLQAFLEKTDDNTVRNLQLYASFLHLSGDDQISKFWEPILRTGGKALKFLSLSPTPVGEVPQVLKQNLNCSFNTLFSVCSNIRELDLFECHFEKNICKALSNLRHLLKVQLLQCALVSKHNKKQLKEPNPDLLTFVENCQNITEFHLYGCEHHRDMVACLYINYDLLALAKLMKLESLTLYSICYIGQWAFLKAISEKCKFLTTMRIKVMGYGCDKVSYLPILESARYLKHLAIDISELHLRSVVFWRFISHATSLESLCIKSSVIGFMNVLSGIKMIKSLPQLHVLHVHLQGILGMKTFREQILRTLEEDKSGRILCFEFLINDWELECLTSKKILPCDITEMCHKSRSPAIPRF